MSICSYYLQGNCVYGTKCKFIHPDPAESASHFAGSHRGDESHFGANLSQSFLQERAEQLTVSRSIFSSPGSQDGGQRHVTIQSSNADARKGGVSSARAANSPSRLEIEEYYKLCQGDARQMILLKGGIQWKLSCYAAGHFFPCFAGFVERMPEEDRVNFLAVGNSREHPDRWERYWREYSNAKRNNHNSFQRFVSESPKIAQEVKIEISDVLKEAEMRKLSEEERIRLRRSDPKALTFWNFSEDSSAKNENLDTRSDGGPPEGFFKRNPVTHDSSYPSSSSIPFSHYSNPSTKFHGGFDSSTGPGDDSSAKFGRISDGTPSGLDSFSFKISGKSGDANRDIATEKGTINFPEMGGMGAETGAKELLEESLDECLARLLGVGIVHTPMSELSPYELSAFQSGKLCEGGKIINLPPPPINFCK